VSVPAVMTDPARLPKGQHWRRNCPVCPTRTQGGQAGLEAHLSVVHPGNLALVQPKRKESHHD